MEIFILIIILLAVSPFFGAFFTVEQQTNKIIETFGKFSRVARPGLNLKIPFFERVSGKVNLRIQQLNVEVETKTQDNVFVKVMVSVQYFVVPDKVYQAFYSLTNPEGQIKAFVFDVVRAKVPTMKLDEAFERKDDVATAVKEETSEMMNDFGYGILKALVTDVDPDSKVKIAMNEINAAQRLKVAAIEKGEADKILLVKQAEAEAESKALQGKGIADQRRAIIEGLQESVSHFQESVAGSTAKDVMNLVLMTQYFDTLKDIGGNSKTNTIIIPHSPGALNDISNQLTQAVVTGTQVNHN